MPSLTHTHTHTHAGVKLRLSFIGFNNPEILLLKPLAQLFNLALALRDWSHSCKGTFPMILGGKRCLRQRWKVTDLL